MGDVCSPVFSEGEYPEFSNFDGALSPPSLIFPFRFPETAGEGGLWSADQSLDWVAITNSLFRRVAEDEDIPRGSRRNFGVMNFANADAAWYILPHFAENEAVKVVSSITNWGGTGGETDELCIGKPGAKLSCATFHHFSGYEGYRISDTGGVVMFGEGLSMDGDGVDEGPNNAWVANSPEEPLSPVKGIGSFGRVVDAAFGPDGRIAMLTPTIILLIDPKASGHHLLNRPDRSAAIEWLSNGELAVMARNGVLHMGKPEEGFRPTQLVAEAEFQSTDGNGEEGTVWLSESVDGRFLGVGVNQAVMLVDAELAAPMTDAISIPDKQLDGGRTVPEIVIGEDGALTVNVNGRIYRRQGVEEGVRIADLIDPEAPLR